MPARSGCGRRAAPARENYECSLDAGARGEGRGAGGDGVGLSTFATGGGLYPRSSISIGSRAPAPDPAGLLPMEFSFRRISVLPGLLTLPPGGCLTELELREHDRLDAVLPGKKDTMHIEIDVPVVVVV